MNAPVDPVTTATTAARRRRWIITFILIDAWLVVVAIGMKIVLSYASAPGPHVEPPAEWPADMALPHRDKRPTLVVAIHPKCPCSRATMNELGRVMNLSAGRLDAHVLFFRPGETPEGWERTDLWHFASEIPGVTKSVDIDGRACRRLGLTTSGATVLYNASGNRAFFGGITAARGHAGDNLGGSAILAIINRQVSPATSTPVFGCPIFEAERRESECETAHSKGADR